MKKIPNEIFRAFPFVINKLVGKEFIEEEPASDVLSAMMKSVSVEDLHKIRSMLSPEQRKVVDEIWQRIQRAK